MRMVEAPSLALAAQQGSQEGAKIGQHLLKHAVHNLHPQHPPISHLHRREAGNKRLPPIASRMPGLPLPAIGPEAEALEEKSLQPPQSVQGSIEVRVWFFFGVG
jgi:hypothetical protein